MQDSDLPPDRVELPEFQNAWSRLKECHASANSTDGPMHLRLRGQSGLGKTFLLEQYHAACPKKRSSKSVHVPVALITIPSAPTVKGIYIAALESLDIHGAVGTLEGLRHRTKTLYKACGVEMLFIDELNNLTDRGQSRTREAVSDALKELVDTIKRPTIFSGASRSHAIFDANMQLRSRVMSTLTFQPFDLDARFNDLRGFIDGLSQLKLLDETSANWLSSADIASRMFFATDGIHRNISKFIVHVANAIRGGQRAADTALLAEIFQLYLWEDAPPHLNPFHTDFPMRRLCEPGEPYSPTVLDGDNHVDGSRKRPRGTAS